MTAPVRTCARCGNTRPIRARGLCKGCYTTARGDGTLADYPRTNHRAAEIAEEHEFLTSQGLTEGEVADRLGINVRRLRDALRRAEAAA